MQPLRSLQALYHFVYPCCRILSRYRRERGADKAEVWFVKEDDGARALPTQLPFLPPCHQIQVLPYYLPICLVVDDRLVVLIDHLQAERDGAGHLTLDRDQ